MYISILHGCGGKAHLTHDKLIAGWNQYCCGRCGEVFFRWITKQMLQQEQETSTSKR